MLTPGTTNIPRERALVPIEDHVYDLGLHRCGRCGRQTHYLDLGFQIPLCAYPCYGLMWAAYWQALRE